MKPVLQQLWSKATTSHSIFQPKNQPPSTQNVPYSFFPRSFHETEICRSFLLYFYSAGNTPVASPFTKQRIRESMSKMPSILLNDWFSLRSFSSETFCTKALQLLLPYYWNLVTRNPKYFIWLQPSIRYWNKWRDNECLVYLNRKLLFSLLYHTVLDILMDIMAKYSYPLVPNAPWMCLLASVFKQVWLINAFNYKTWLHWEAKPLAESVNNLLFASLPRLLFSRFNFASSKKQVTGRTQCTSNATGGNNILECAITQLLEY